ncbi:LAMI_0F00628g1_1 [Lachancea mirantina]|uniref:LAMI_0F00628g1_1 n=1 Tax=Lachancea mirantina TaxID=1230905 RepID=A0A1G4JVG5_9SACH|nr:LAMI_0F00628g1_1 [Lachancea mirantina]
MTTSLRQQIKEKYDSALKNGDVVFTESSSSKHKDSKSGVSYMVTYAPSLLKKPERRDEDASKKKDPFAEPEPELTVVDNVNGENEFRLVLNKFPVVPEHALLVTREFKPQTSTLTPKDLLTSYKLLQSLDDEDEGVRHMVFYNCGANSGSSQDHKHLQLLALPKKFAPLQDRLCSGQTHYIPNMNSEPLQDKNVSYAHFVVPLPEDETNIDEELLAMTFVSLLQRTLTFFQDWTSESERLSVGYNVMMTRSWLCLVPRSSAFSKKLNIGFNATGYAGLILIKDQEVFSHVQENPHVIDEFLLECGFPNTAGSKSDQYSY